MGNFKCVRPIDQKAVEDRAIHTPEDGRKQRVRIRTRHKFTLHGQGTCGPPDEEPTFEVYLGGRGGTTWGLGMRS